jgi:peptidoglycan/LPS O-acetylase OafA/YrhL
VPPARPLFRSMTYQEYRQTKSFPGLDGLRAVAATLVVVFHFGGSSVRFLQGWVGVQMFFVLSGYLITTLALREIDRTGRLDFRAFYLRRQFRIVPVYLVVLALVWLQCELNHSGHDRMRVAFPYFLTFFNDIAPSTVYSQTWTLGIEQKYYLVWPLLAFGLASRTCGRIGVALTAIVLLIPLWDLRMLHSVHFIVLLLGSLLALVMHHPRGFAALRPLLTPLGSIVVGVAYLAFHLQLTGLLETFQEAQVVPFFGLAVCMLLPAVIGPGPTRWLLSRRPMSFVGERSYSLYLVQAFAHTAAVGLLPTIAGRPSPQGALVTWVVGVLFADLLFRWVEQPLIRTGKRLSRRRPPRTVVLPEETVVLPEETIVLPEESGVVAPTPTPAGAGSWRMSVPTPPRHG